MTSSAPSLFFSNELDLLFEKLNSLLFSYEKELFYEKYVIVPHPYFKDWLYHRFSLDKACLGLRFFSLQEALCHFQKTQNSSFPLSSKQLFWKLLDHLKNPSAQKELGEYFQGFSLQENLLTRKKAKDLAYYTAQLFTLYAIYGKPERKGSWQSFFWDKVYTLPSFFDLAKQPIYQEDKEVHIFYFAEMPPVFLEYFYRFSKKNKVYFYLFSPCKDFWEEDLSDFYLRKIRKKLSPSLVKEYFTQRHPLLANWGNIGKFFLQQLDGYDFEIEELYSESFSTSLLSEVKKDLLEGSLEKKQRKKDDSLHVYGTGFSLLKEVQIVKHLIYKKIEQDPKSSSSILVLVPDISLYEPFIHFVFQSSSFDYAILGTSLFSQSLLLQGFLHLLEFIEKKGDPTIFITLLENPLFSKKQTFSDAEVLQIKKWMEEVQIREGFLEQNVHSFQKGIERLLKGAFFYVNSPFSDQIDLTQIELLTKWIELLQDLEKKGSFLKNEEEKPLKEWAILCESLLSEFFSIKEEERAFSFLQDLLKPLQEEVNHFSFSFVFYYLQKFVERKKGAYHPSCSEGIQFVSLELSPPFSKDHIFLIGMEENSFLQREVFSSSFEIKNGIFPKEEKERYLLLQLFFQAKKSLTFLYKDLSEEEGEAVLPSLALEELFSFLEEFYGIQKQEMLSSYSSSFELTPSSLQGNCSSLPEKKLSFIPFEKEEPSSTFSLPFKELLLLCKNPFRFFFQKKGLSLPEQKGEDAFFLSPLNKHFLHSGLLQSSLEESLSLFQEKGKMPSGIFEKISIEKEKKQEELFERALSLFSLQKQDLFAVSLEDCFFLYQGKKVFLEGEIPLVCKEGILLFAEKKEETLFTSFPYILIVNHPFFEEKGIKKQLLFLKDGQKQEVFLEEREKKWEVWFSYYLFAKKEPSLFFPPLLKGLSSSLQDLQNSVEKEMRKRGFIDPYFSWFFEQEYEVQNCETWVTHLKELMGSLYAF